MNSTIFINIPIGNMRNSKAYHTRKVTVKYDSLDTDSEKEEYTADVLYIPKYDTIR